MELKIGDTIKKIYSNGYIIGTIKEFAKPVDYSDFIWAIVTVKYCTPNFHKKGLSRVMIVGDTQKEILSCVSLITDKDELMVEML